jgi:large subunit ribosomal protein L4e
MKVSTLAINGTKESEIELPIIFSTPFRKDLIAKAFTNLTTHKFQPQGRRPTAGMDVVARSNDPPTGQGRSRIAKMRGGGGGRQGEAGGVASVRGGRQAHPPKVQKVIVKKLNKKENKLALCSAIAATQSKEIIQRRGHKIGNLKTFPMIISDDIESVTKTKDVLKILDALQLMQDVDRLKSRKPRTGKSALRGRGTKIGKSILFVVSDSKKLSHACGSIPGIDVQTAKNLSVLDLAPGGVPIRLVVYTKNALKEIEKIKSPHLELLVHVA